MSIYTKQNEEGMLNFLKIQRIVYSKAKRMQQMYNVGSLVVTIVFIVLTNVFQSSILWNISIFSAFLVFISGILINIYVLRQKTIAAGIQQRFDIYVLGVPVSYMGLSVPKTETVIQLGIKYKTHKIEKLENWYSNYSAFEYEKQVLFCQQENINWDKPLRLTWLWIVASIMTIMSVAILTIGIISNDIHLMFSLFSWLVPCFVWGIKIITNLYKDIKRLKILEQELDGIELLDKTQAEQKIKDVQQLIWQHRIDCYLIPDFLYRINFKKQQEREDLLAEQRSKNLIDNESK